MTREEQAARQRSAVAYYAAGESLAQVSRRVGLCREYIRTLVKGSGAQLRAPHFHHGVIVRWANQYGSYGGGPARKKPKPIVYAGSARKTVAHLDIDALYAGRRYE